MWNRREWALGIAAGVSLVTLGGVRARTTPSTPPQSPARTPFARVQLAVSNRAEFCYLPLTIADRLGYFAAEGLDVQIHEIGDPAQALHALVSGAVQALSGPYRNAIALRARGQSFPSIVVQGRSPQLVMGVSRRALGGFRDLRDLRGHRVAVAGNGSCSHRMMQQLLASAQMRADAVRFVPLGSPSAALASFRNGLVEAICYGDPVITQLEQDGDLKVVADTRTVRGSAEVFGGPLPAGCLCVAEDYLNNHPAECQALADAVVRALKWLQTAGLSDINRTVPESYFQGDRALYLSAFSRAREGWTPDGLMPETGPATLARLMARFDDAPSLRQVDLSETYTNALALKAKARFKA